MKLLTLSLAFICLLPLLDELLDLPHLLGVGIQTPINWAETFIEVALIAFVGAFILIASHRSITDRKRAEEALQRLTDELARKNTELEQIVYVTSHDLRSPLVNVQGFSKELQASLDDIYGACRSGSVPEDIKDKIAPILDKDIPETLGFIHKSIAKMDMLLSGLLRLSRLGRAALTIQTLDMNRLMADIVASVKYQLKEKEASLEVGDLPPCQGDAAQVNQLFSNLLENALKFLDPGRKGRIAISGRVEDRRAIYIVEDNGIGIAPEHLVKIFDIFHRLHPDEYSGEGLGLTIVRRVLDRLDGEVWVESVLGTGSRFFVALPMA